MQLIDVSLYRRSSGSSSRTQLTLRLPSVLGFLLRRTNFTSSPTSQTTSSALDPHYSFRQSDMNPSITYSVCAPFTAIDRHRAVTLRRRLPTRIAADIWCLAASGSTSPRANGFRQALASFGTLPNIPSTDASWGSHPQSPQGPGR